MGLGENKHARQYAELKLLDLGVELEREKAIIPMNEERFWELLATAAAAKIGMVLTEDNPRLAMNDVQAHNFEDTVIPFGEHKGKRVGDVSPKYWLVVKENTFNTKLLQWMHTPRFQQLQR